MKAPNKIYLYREKPKDYFDEDWYESSASDVENVEYIRKDLLLEWLKEKIRDYWADDENTMGIYPYALEEVINKLNSL